MTNIDKYADFIVKNLRTQSKDFKEYATYKLNIFSVDSIPVKIKIQLYDQIMIGKKFNCFSIFMIPRENYLLMNTKTKVCHESYHDGHDLEKLFSHFKDIIVEFLIALPTMKFSNELNRFLFKLTQKELQKLEADE